jgi:hypothetical protein
VVWVEGPFPVPLGSSPLSVWIINVIILNDKRQDWNEFGKQSVCIMNLNWSTAAGERLVECCCVVEQEKIYWRVKYVWNEGVQCTRYLCAVGINLWKKPLCNCEFCFV